MPAGGLYLTSNSGVAREHFEQRVAGDVVRPGHGLDAVPKKNAAKRNHLQIYHCVVTSVVEIYRYFKTNCN
ncbi:hypothetical protein PR003_g17926 [Phytophthora rubi]|uniref:Uncharacterized protein n=1 Tax=Phytophthora rubi TaxID=129364 RepID=A0A6A3KA11_9STRA|nr:hypothetical protein PR002_g17180 [Phytophthora rubi]KAE9319605.1 hypothetical protein PR003_g17926 [Phytophthora rubi]